MGKMADALTRLAYVIDGWQVLDQKGSVLVLRKKGVTMMCHGIGTIYSISNDDNYYTNNYWDLFMPLPGLYTKPRILLIGLGGGTIPRQIAAFYKDASIDAVEIDAGIAELATKHFDMGNAKIIVADGAEFVKKADSHYDLIILDAFKGSKVPEAFMSNEFYEDAYNILSKEGLLAINSMESIDTTAMSASGFNVYSLRSSIASGNNITICSKAMDSGQIKAGIAGMEISDSVKRPYALLGQVQDMRLNKNVH
jgi:hypothetical protein